MAKRPKAALSFGVRNCVRCGAHQDARHTTHCLACGTPIPMVGTPMAGVPYRSGGAPWGLIIAISVFALGVVGAAITFFFVVRSDARPAPLAATAQPPATSTEETVSTAATNTAAPPSTVPTTSSTAAAVQAAWIAGPITGHDNSMASFRRAKISAGAGGHSVTIDNQFHFTCQVKFDETGRPNRFEACKSADGWSASPPNLNVTCKVTGKTEACTSATYTMFSPEKFNIGPAQFALIRSIP